jgi:hypothetical protein
MKKDEPVQLSVPFEVICVNAQNKPKEIPSHLWLEKDKRYTVIGIGHTLDGAIGFKLDEIELTEDCYPFDCFNPKRFGIPAQDKSKTLEEELAELGIQVEEFELEPQEL